MALDAAAAADQGWRPTMEDRHVLRVTEDEVVGAVFDGHSGSAVAELAAVRFEALLQRGTVGGALRAIDREARLLPGGACAVAFRLRGERLEVANLGDAELAVVDGAVNVRVLTELHRLDNPAERARVLAAGALIEGPYVVDPVTRNGLMPTRTLGDADFERVGVLGEPFERMATFRQGWLVAACDGLWDVLAPDELPALLADARSAREAVDALAREALHGRGSTDNVTVVVVRRTQGGHSNGGDVRGD